MMARLRFTRPSLRTVTSSSSTVFLPEVVEVVEVFLSTSNMVSSVPRPAGSPQERRAWALCSVMRATMFGWETCVEMLMVGATPVSTRTWIKTSGSED